jgi:hypothetical protein
MGLSPGPTRRREAEAGVTPERAAAMGRHLVTSLLAAALQEDHAGARSGREAHHPITSAPAESSREPVGAQQWIHSCDALLFFNVGSRLAQLRLGIT